MTPLSAYKSEKARKKSLECYEMVLANWPVPYMAHEILTNFGKTHVMVSGDNKKQSLVLLHGGAGNSTMWFYNIDALSKHFKVYAIDIIGEAGKSAGTRPKLTSNGHARWLKEVFDKFKINKAAICGASLGGTIAHQFALQYPQCITALVLLAPPSLAKMKFAFVFKTLLANMFPTEFFAKRFLKYMSAHGDEFSKDEIQSFVTQFRSYKLNIDKIPLITDEEISHLPNRTLVMFGGNEIMYDVDKVAAHIRAVAPSIEISFIENAKHTISIDQPDLVNKILIHFIQESSKE